MSQIMQVQVPAGISAGMQFQVQIGAQIMAIACPQGAGPGSMIQVKRTSDLLHESICEARCRAPHTTPPRHTHTRR